VPHLGRQRIFPQPRFDRWLRQGALLHRVAFAQPQQIEGVLGQKGRREEERQHAQCGHR
jgi:hypothetical protein